MAYGQVGYGDIQGINGKYRIADIGCLLTAFCNLEQRFGGNIDPAALNRIFIDRGVYIDVDDGVRDDLGWSSVASYDAQIQVTATGGAGWPNTNNAIVKFAYKSPKTGGPMTHFCLVNDINSRTIVDSWDGVVRSPGYYGEPVAWAAYAHTVAQPVTPAVPATPMITLEQLTQLYSDLLKRAPDQSGIDHYVGHFTYDFVAADIKKSAEYATVNAPKPVAPPAPVVTTPPDAPIPIPTSSVQYEVVKTILGYSTSNTAANHMDAKSTVSAGKYYIFNTRADASGKMIALNVTKEPGKPGAWINPDDNVTDPPKPVSGWSTVDSPVATEPPAPGSTIAPDEPTPVPVSVNNTPNAWKTTYQTLRKDRKPVLYVSINPKVIKIYDLEQKRSAIDLMPYTELHIVGLFTKDGVMYGRAKKVAEMGYWYGIPLTILNTYDELYAYQPTKGAKMTDYPSLIFQKIRKLIQDIKF